jgi:hypothetical protein
MFLSESWHLRGLHEKDKARRLNAAFNDHDDPDDPDDTR